MAPRVPDPPLSADGIALRVPAESDTDWIAQSCNDADIARFIVGMPSPYTDTDARQFLARAAEWWEAGTKAVFVIQKCPGGDQLGLVELRPEPNDLALGVIGYWLSPEARGRGAATIAVQLVLRWAFHELGIQRVELTTDPENVASQRVAGRAGFTREGLLRRSIPTSRGRRDSVMFSLLPEDLD